ncbi:MAG: Holliday junction branch migration protein RuvA [Synergistaceae bacterium]|jgi:Holliday junction DNA helicase RuvA|nr:Holliday junction branch migration protein RuvA [Synergistaceae bacterium]
MIRSLSGTVLSVESDSICLDVSGFGIEVFASGTLISSAAAGEFLSCRAYMQVSEAGIYMFGFSDETERDLFLEITQVKTMGGKLSIALLRHLDAPSVISAIMSGDPSRLAVPGLGPKRAERICFELRPKIEKKFSSLASFGTPVLPSARSAEGEVIGGLMGLGFSQGEASRAVSQCRAESGERALNEEELMMLALHKLQRR